MLGIALLYIGAVLVINGMYLLGKVDGKSAGVMNIITGGLTLILNAMLIFKATEAAEFFLAAAGLLFCFTYIYLAISIFFNLELDGFGWYCLFVAITALPSSYLSFSGGDARFGIMWLIWAFLWFLFFLLAGLKKPIGNFTAWVTILVGVVTCWIPGYLMLIGKW